MVDTDRYSFQIGVGGADSSSGEAPSEDAGSQRGGSGGRGAPGSGMAVGLADAMSPLGTDTQVPCAGCRIDGVCVAAGLRGPAGECEVCDPERDDGAWSNREGSCDDGLFCTLDDHCEERRCTGASRSCDDGVICNGSSVCDERTRACTPGVNQCGAGEVCDIASGTCAATCDGCLIEGVCVPPGAERMGNPCLVCQPELSALEYRPVPDKVCGGEPGECSDVDRCDAAGVCQPNHRPAETPCGSHDASGCRQPDACDGAGQCTPRFTADGLGCEDGFFCTSGDTCVAGSCVSSQENTCPAAQVCNETADACQCADGGCFIAGACFAPGALDPQNPCRICDPSRTTADFSPNAGAACGSSLRGPCTEPDRCDEGGVCQPNDVAVGAPCRDESDCLNASSCDGSGNCPFEPKPDDTTCNDGVLCNGRDSCFGGECFGGVPRPGCIEP